MRVFKITVVTLLLIVNLLHADFNPKYGLTFSSDGGAGITIVNKNYSASFLYSSIENKNGFDEDQTNLEFNAKYRHFLEENTNLTVGIRQLIIAHKPADDDDSDENSKLALSAGIDHQLTSRILIFAETDVVSIQTNDDGKQEDGIFNFARIGTSILF